MIQIKERKSELAKLETVDCGKPLKEAEGDMEDVAGCFKYYADLAEGLDAKQNTPITLAMKAFKSYVIKEPIGVVDLVIPWNYPLLMAAWKVAPALAAGCAAILKPSELASVTCLELAEVCREVDLPAGVLNILTGLGPEAGAPLASHSHVDKIAFTGSTATGVKIMTAAAQMVKPVSLELGGKSPIVVFEDVDIDKAIEWTLYGCFYTNGQICSATSRLIVHIPNPSNQTLHLSLKSQFKSSKHHWASNYGVMGADRSNERADISGPNKTEFLDRLVKWSENIKISDPLEEGCKLGPIVSRGQYEKVLKFISTAKSEGATILYGGARPEHLKKGFFVEPTIITDVKTTMQIWREEVFGPVLSVKTFTTEDEALELANDTQFCRQGLCGSIVHNHASSKLHLEASNGVALGVS
ncbi:hypothetical protein DITRI_Ditri04bG0062300 [Diplodiscus trichospermus]